MPSLNGLVDIKADSVNSSVIESEAINSTNIDTKTLFVDGFNLGEQVNINAQKLTAITYTATPTPLTTISSNVKLNNTSLIGTFDVDGSIIIRDPTNPTNIGLKISYEPSLFGFCFTQEMIGHIMKCLNKKECKLKKHYLQMLKKN